MQSTLFDFTDDQAEDQSSENDVKGKLTKDEKIEKERYRLLGRLSAGYVNTCRDKVAWILNHYPESRDSDITLQLKYWETFESHIYTGNYVNSADLYRLTCLTGITRERARIQNTYELFKANEGVRQFRSKRSDQEKEKAVEDRPSSLPMYTVYMDESGKNEENLIVGSVWFLDAGKSLFDVYGSLRDYKKREKFDKEFHFSQMKRQELSTYKGLIELFLREVPAVSFIIISVPTRGIQDKQDAFKQLFYHLLVHGIEYENDTKRAELPRMLQVWKDAEEEGSDRLLVADLSDRLKQCSDTRFDKKLHINTVSYVDSESNTFMQIADLFSASANRTLNQAGLNRNHKTEFAEFLLEAVGVDDTFSPNDKIGDMVAHISI